jgi:hypothetical protein
LTHDHHDIDMIVDESDFHEQPPNEEELETMEATTEEEYKESWNRLNKESKKRVERIKKMSPEEQKAEIHRLINRISNWDY